MDIARNYIAPETGDAPGRASDEVANLQLPSDLQQIDWQALRSRLFAAQGLPGAHGTDLAATRLRLRGSFDGCAASMLDTYQTSLNAINPDNSSNGKPVQGNTKPVADVHASDERG